MLATNILILIVGCVKKLRHLFDSRVDGITLCKEHTVHSLAGHTLSEGCGPRDYTVQVLPWQCCPCSKGVDKCKTREPALKSLIS